MRNHDLTPQVKAEKLLKLIENEKKLDFIPETTTFYIVPCSCKLVLDMTMNFDEILKSVNNFILDKNITRNYGIPLLGNFGSFIIWKLQQLAKDNENLTVFSNGDIDIYSVGITIQLNLFKPFKTILRHINHTISDVEKKRKVKIGHLEYRNTPYKKRHA